MTGRSSAWLERSVRDAEVAGSNPVAPNLSAEYAAVWPAYFRVGRESRLVTYGGTSARWQRDSAPTGSSGGTGFALIRIGRHFR